MSKSNRTGTLVVSAMSAVKIDGTIHEINDGGVIFTAREFGRQTKIEQFYPFVNLVAFTDEGEGFVVVNQEQPVAVFNGSIEYLADGVAITTEGGRVVTAGNIPGVRYQVLLDGEDGPTTVLGKEGRRQSARFDTKSAKAEPVAKKGKVEKSGKRR